MKTKDYCLVLTVITGVLCLAAGDEIELPRFIEGDLIGPANPALSGIEQLCVTIIPPDADPNKWALGWRTLKTEVDRKLQDAGIRVFAPKQGVKYEPAIRPNLTVYIEVLKLVDSAQCVLRVQTALARPVSLEYESRLSFKADVWKTEPVMQIVGVQNMPTKVIALVTRQVEEFICVYQVANTRGAQRRDANDAAQRSTKQAEPTDEAAPAYTYVGSKNSNVFHKLDCRWAKNISASNLVGYASRDEAIAASKKPCRWCKP